MLRIKLVKTGKKDRPTWRVVVVEKARTGKGTVTDYIGNYNPHSHPKDFKIDVEKYEKWVGNGAQPTDTVKRLKGKFIDKNKDYQKEVETKVYKSKKSEEKQESKKPINQETKVEDKKEDVKVEEPVVGAEDLQPEKVEEPAIETNGDSSEEEKNEDKAE